MGPSQSRSAPSVGANTSPVDNMEHTALFLTVDTPHLYWEAMAHSDANGWVEAIMEEYNNLQQKNVFIEVGILQDKHVHEGCLVFSEKIGRASCRERV